ncbi:MAG: sulfatase [Anaerolineae bacterium]|nr:sulfatase [Anaerolineae bacterium]
MKLPLQLRFFISLFFLALLSGCISFGSKNDVVVLEVEKRPNIILILADDLDERLGTIQYMPNLKKYITDQGVTVEDFLVTTPMCCPSRVNLLRGQYTHNHQVYNNSAPDGGFPKFYELGTEDSTLAVWLQAAGYRTALIGKYLNAYPNADDRTYIPPGWTEWYSPGRKNAYDGYDYYLNENGVLVPYGPDEENFFTDVMSRKSTDFIERAAKDEAPFFLYITPFAPHEPAAFARRHADLLQSIQAPRPPSFNEVDINDKSPLLRSNPLLTLEDEAKIDEYYRRRVLSMLAVDEMIADLFVTLEASGELENTYVIFTSDQGFTLGQHRLLRGKSSLFEEDIVVPFIVRGPGLPAGTTIDPFLASVIDIAPTLAEWGGVVPPAFVDGRSFASTLVNGSVPADWRNGFLLQQYTFGGEEEEASIPGLLNLLGAIQNNNPLSYSAGIRTLQYTYNEHPDGFVELYDLTQDPYQMENISSIADPSLMDAFSKWLSQLKTCKSESCRALESQEVP